MCALAHPIWIYRLPWGGEMVIVVTAASVRWAHVFGLVQSQSCDCLLDTQNLSLESQTTPGQSGKANECSWQLLLLLHLNLLATG